MFSPKGKQSYANLFSLDILTPLLQSNISVGLESEGLGMHKELFFKSFVFYNNEPFDMQIWTPGGDGCEEIAWLNRTLQIDVGGNQERR